MSKPKLNEVDEYQLLIDESRKKQKEIQEGCLHKEIVSAEDTEIKDDQETFKVKCFQCSLIINLHRNERCEECLGRKLKQVGDTEEDHVSNLCTIETTNYECESCEHKQVVKKPKAEYL